MSKIVIDLTNAKSNPTFKNVKVNNFFINQWGQVCQKYNDTSYNTICNVDGENFSDRFDSVSPMEPIMSILDITFKR